VRALTKLSAGPGLSLVDRPEPECGPADVKIRVLRAGICGTDLHLAGWDEWAESTLQPPLVIGHEFYGEVVEVGEDVTGVAIGDRASGEGHIVCGRCRNCRAGRRHLCIRTQGIGVNRDGAFADHVVITGAGPIGVMAAAIARHAGARYVVVTDASDYRLALAEHAGADLTINVTRESLADAQAHLGMKEGFDIGLEMSGAAPAVTDMIANMNHGGRIALLGLPHQSYELDWGKVITHMITLKGIYGREMYDTWYAMSQMIATSERFRSAVAQVITHRFPAEQWEEAFETARSGQCGKVVLDWS